ncbi:MAG: dynamin family protein, partial [Chloroflexota bacterium]
MDTTVTGSRGAESENEASLRSYARRRAQVAGCLDELATINAEVGQAARAARIRESRDALLEQRFTLLVLGEFKRGKSTLVNRLVGRDVLPVGAAPTTAVITRITYGEEPAARLILADGTERAVELGRLTEEITLAQTDEGVNQRRHAGIARAEVTIPAVICRDGVDIVDSPGLGEHSTRTEVTYEALPAADAVIFVADAAQLGSEDEGFVRERLLGAEIDHVFFVINKWDRVFNEAEDPAAEIES